MSDVTMNALQQRAFNHAERAGFHENTPRPVAEVLMLAVSELAEALEEYRHGHGTTEVYFREDGKPEGLPIEFADCAIRLLDTAQEYGFNLADMIELKMNYNEKRPYKHGGKVI